MSRRRINNRQQGQPSGLENMSHERLAEKGVALGLRAFCVSWPTKTLIRKIQEIENASR